MVGSNRIVPAQKIVSPLGNSALQPEDEKAMRKSLVKKALEVLQTDPEEQKVFP